jgi:hypothetical protein
MKYAIQVVITTDEGQTETWDIACVDGGKDSGQKLTDVSYRSAARPCNPLSGCGNESCTIPTPHIPLTSWAQGYLLNPSRPPRWVVTQFESPCL